MLAGGRRDRPKMQERGAVMRPERCYTEVTKGRENRNNRDCRLIITTNINIREHT